MTDKDAQNKITRLRQLIAYFANGSQTEFARSLGKRQSVVSAWLQRASFNEELILSRYPEIDANWLLHGEGNMLKSGATTDNTHTVGSGNSMTAAPNINGLIDALNKQQELTELVLKQNEMLIELLKNNKNKES